MNLINILIQYDGHKSDHRSTNVVPAVGMGEGATPRCKRYSAMAKFKKFILYFINNFQISHTHFSHKLLSDGALPLLASPHGGRIPPCPLYLTAPSSLGEPAAFRSWQSAHSVSRVFTVLLKPISDSFLHRGMSYIIHLYTTICP
jgi:hypothetical protein